MIIQSMWITRKGSDLPEMLVAWDGHNCDEYPLGFEEDCAKTLASMGDDLDQVRYITLSVDSRTLYKAFEDVIVESTVIDYRNGIRGGSK